MGRHIKKPNTARPPAKVSINPDEAPTPQLKGVREQLNISLSEMCRRMGLEQTPSNLANLNHLENQTGPQVIFKPISEAKWIKYAKALGIKKIVIEL